MPLEVWSKCLDVLSLSQRIACRAVCQAFKKETEDILRKQQKLWLKCTDDKVFDCFDKDHFVDEKDSIEYKYEKCPSLEEMTAIACLFPSLVVLKLETREEFYDKTFPLLKLFPSIVCLVAPGYLSDKDLIGSNKKKPVNLKHLLAKSVVLEDCMSHLSLESLEVFELDNVWGFDPDNIPVPSKRFTALNFNEINIDWIPETIEVFNALITFQRYSKRGQASHPNLRKVGLRWPYWCSLQAHNIIGLIHFLDDNKHVKELSLTAATGNVWSLSDLMPSLKFIEWLEVSVYDDYTVKVFKEELRSNAVNLKYLSFVFYFNHLGDKGHASDDERLQRVINSLPDDTDNLTVVFEGWRRTPNVMDEFICQKLEEGNPKQVTMERINDMEDDWKYGWEENPLIQVEGVTTKWQFLPIEHSFLESEIIVLRKSTA